jgi:hypothetical protein
MRNLSDNRRSQLMKVQTVSPAYTLSEVISRTREFHNRLAESLENSVKTSTDERIALLLSYIYGHEERLSRALKVIQETAEKKQLETWFYEFSQKHNVIRKDREHRPFSEMTTNEILAEVGEEHNEIVELYRYLYGRAGSTPATELLRELVDLEEHETMRLMQEASRTDEI